MKAMRKTVIKLFFSTSSCHEAKAKLTFLAYTRKEKQFATRQVQNMVRKPTPSSITITQVVIIKC